ncbi:LLM class F420-dependent oxidoreductase [Spongisporangium articulatum]|uniref:LLM class F420-dependent oxidoreductase n=1 Tax=Spongisporangium articulatum TaxID=3362603 RepID=A0ABW8AT03_9ACTN
MDLRVFVEPQQGNSYAQQSRFAQAAEAAGYGAFFRSDHFLRMGGGSPLPGPTESWTTLAGIALETSRIRLGTLVTSATFRHPGVLAIQVAQVDDMSGGRVDFGFGAGWFETEHTAYGLPFPGVGERFDRLEEQLEIITNLWTTPGGYSFSGRHYQVVDSPGLPKPVQERVPVIIGGIGKKRTPELTAKYATEFNVPFKPFDDTVAAHRRAREACEQIGRDPSSLTLSVALTLNTGKDEAQIAARAAKVGRDVAELREIQLGGSPAEIVDKLGRYAEHGVTRAYFQVLDLDDLEHIEYAAAEIMPQLA